jgi:glycosyltransferase involved in cell wall biosynthesis
MNNSMPRVLAILPGFMPSTLMCVVKPFLGLQQSQHIRFRVAMESYFDVTALQSADLVVFCRNVEPRYAYILDAVLSRCMPYVYDIDDNLYEVPANVAEGQYYRDPERTALLTRYLRSASLVRVYSAALLDKFRPFNENTLQVSTVLDWRLIRQRRLEKVDNVKIVYATSRREDHLFHIFTPALQRVMQDYAGRVEAHFLGYQPIEFQGMPGIHYQKYNPNYDKYMHRFSSAGYDIGLAPMLDDDFHRAKTNNKFREYGASEIAGIYSDVPLYSEWIEDGKTGLLVENQANAWYAAMAKLIEDAGLRRHISQMARKKVHELYSEERFEQQWWDQIWSVLSQPAGKVFQQDVMAQPTVESPAGQIAELAPSKVRIWQQMLRRGIVRLQGGELRRSVINTRFHLENFWWLFKINRLKRL